MSFSVEDEQHTCSGCFKQAVRETLGPKRVKVAGDGIGLHNEVIHVVFFKGNYPIVSRLKKCINSVFMFTIMLTTN